jgi:hypothetical protein
MNELDKMARKIQKLVDDYDIIDVSIATNGYRLTKGDNESGWHRKEQDIPSKISQYANDQTLHMTFEGELYRIINHDGGTIYRKLVKIFEDAGYYFEQGYAWDLSLYKI